MIPNPASTLALAALLLPLGAVAAEKPINLAQEYEQVRAIAQRDPKVRAAYADADRRLAAKIVEIDPALKGYVPGKSVPAPAPAATASTRTKAQPAPAKVKPAAPAPAKPQGAKHVVAKGETLGGIAAKYDVSTASLKNANRLKDEDKLVAGQTLIIPGRTAPAKKTASAPAAAPKPKTEPTAKSSGGFWDSLKSAF